MTNKPEIILFTSSPSVVGLFTQCFGKRLRIIMNYSAKSLRIDSKVQQTEVFNSSIKHLFIEKLYQQDRRSICISCFSGYIFSKRDMSHFVYPILNFHTGKIPGNRGRSPLFWDIIERKKNSFGTLHAISEKIDKGRVLEEVSVEICSDDNPKTLAEKILEKAFKESIFLKWSNSSREDILSIKPVVEEGFYKKSFNPNDNFVSEEYAPDQLLAIWKCYQIWGKILINGTYYNELRANPMNQAEVIQTKSKTFLYGWKH